MRFLGEFVVFGVIMFASCFAVITVGKRVRRRVRPKFWAGSAAACALLAAVIGWSSRNLQESCLQERNEGCIDAGGAGTQLLIVAGYVVFALASAFLLARD